MFVSKTMKNHSDQGQGFYFSKTRGGKLEIYLAGHILLICQSRRMISRPEVPKSPRDKNWRVLHGATWCYMELPSATPNATPPCRAGSPWHYLLLTTNTDSGGFWKLRPRYFVAINMAQMIP